MSAVNLFNEIVNLRNRIDPQMQMDIWVRLFRLLCDNGHRAELDLPYNDFVELLTIVAAASRNSQVRDNVTLASEHLRPQTDDSRPQPASAPAPAAAATQQRSLLNLFAPARSRNEAAVVAGDPRLMVGYKKVCRKLLQYYTLSTTSSTEFQVRDVVACMLYLSRQPSYKPLFHLLEGALEDDIECVPHLEPDQVFNIINIMRDLLELPSATLDFNNIRSLKLTFGKIMHYPLTRFPRIIIVPNTDLSRHTRCTLEDLILQRARALSQLEPQQYVDALDDNRIPYCDDEDFINELLKLTDGFSLPRMFFNATNSIFYTTMENYAMTNCKFDINDYNNIFKVMDSFKELSSQNCGANGIFKQSDLTDSLNIYLGADGSSSSSTLSTLKNKRMKK
uniref:Protein p40 n=1 Tax=Lymantria dispar multicapsid nuclear polyhedrosis virus TaxID=10449 RepID=A0A1B1MR25_NPVLD|nr:protein p40 [Lymantria dispar multiple nucleopolyhedrovirus]